MSPEGTAALPSQFGRYTLVERLAIGGMAEVFRSKIVSSHGFEKILVIKRILPQLAADKTFVSMFIDEAKLTAQLMHPKIVQILDFGDVAGQYFIALEFIDGFDALALLRMSAQRRVRVPIQLAVFVVAEVLEALDYAHNARDMDGRPMQLVHRDISPSNIFISKRGDVKLGDFGIAHARERESKTQAGTLKGKYGYMSPEQVVGATLDGRSDLFAVGIVLAEMMMGRRLFTAAADLDVLLMVRDARIDRLSRYAIDLPPKLDRIVRRSLKKDPALRYQTAAELREALLDYLYDAGQRVSAADLRTFVTDLYDPRPEAVARLMRGDARPRVVVAAAPSGPPRPPERGPVPPRPGAGAGAGPEPTMADPRPAAFDGAGAAAAAPVDPAVANALGAALAQPLSVVDLDQWVSEPERAALAEAGWTPPGGQADARDARSAAGARGRSQATRTDVGMFVSGAPQRPPDSAGDLAVISPMRLFSELAVANETGLLRFEIGGQVKEIYLMGGAPESVSSSVAGERFGEYLVAKGALRAADLERALAALPQYAGKLGDTLVALGLMKALDVFRLLSQQVRDRVLDVFGRTEGTFAFYRGVINEHASFPLNLDTFEILGAGVLGLPAELLEHELTRQIDLRPSPTGRTHIAPESFRLGPTPAQVLSLLDGQQTLGGWMANFPSRDERLTFLRSLYLLVETDLARFD